MPPTGPKRIAPPQVVMDRRVTAIYSALVAGLKTWEVRHAVAQMQVKERRDRAKAFTAALAQQPAGLSDRQLAIAESLHDVPMVWGDEEIPERTLARYIQRARSLLDHEARELSGHRSRALATQLARLDERYAQARRDKKEYAALKAVELTVDLLGLRQHAQALALEHEAHGRSTGERDSDDASDASPTRLPTDPKARADQFAALIAAAVATDPTLRETIGSIVPRGSIMP